MSPLKNLVLLLAGIAAVAASLSTTYAQDDLCQNGAKDNCEARFMIAQSALAAADHWTFKADVLAPDNKTRLGYAELLVHLQGATNNGLTARNIAAYTNYSMPLQHYKDGRIDPVKDTGWREWCGMFALDLIRGGLEAANSPRLSAIGHWNIMAGTGISGVKGFRNITSAPARAAQPGDVCALNKHAHHALIVAVHPTHLETVEGNAECNGSVSTVCKMTRKHPTNPSACTNCSPQCDAIYTAFP